MALLPAFASSDYFVNLATQILIAAIVASSLNILVGHGGLVSLGHAAYLGGAAYLIAWMVAQAGYGHAAAIATTLVAVTSMAAVFGLIALRATGLGFLMITLALGQILWGVAYRWVSVTGGDNGITGLQRPTVLGIDLLVPANFYWLVLAMFIVALAFMALFAASPFGAGLRGTRDQPRRMAALGFNVWLIRWLAFVVAGFWGAVAGILYIYYHQFISPHVLALTNSAEILLMVIAGGVGTLFGPVVGATLVLVLKSFVSAYVTRWTMLLGFAFIAIVIFIPDGLVPGLARMWRRLARSWPIAALLRRSGGLQQGYSTRWIPRSRSET